MSSLHLRSWLSVALEVIPQPAGKHASISILPFYNTYIYKYDIRYVYVFVCIDDTYISTKACTILILKN